MTKARTLINMTENNEKVIKVGKILAQRLTSALTKEGIPYDRLSKLIYTELRNIDDEIEEGDWIEFPGGSTYVREFKPTKKDY